MENKRFVFTEEILGNLDMEQFEEDMETIRRFRDLMDRTQLQHCKLIDERDRLEKLEQDVLHYIEFDIPCEFGDYTTILMNIREKRRNIKNKLNLYFPIKRWAKQNITPKRDLEHVLSDLAYTQKKLEEAVYYPRADKNIKKLDHVSKSLKDFIGEGE